MDWLAANWGDIIALINSIGLFLLGSRIGKGKN